jgi:hypothetical protein
VQWRKILQLLGAALLSVLMCSCPFTADRPREEPDVPAAVAERSDLFVEQDGEPGVYVFQTNDQDLWGPHGTTLWALLDSSQQPFRARELDLTKLSGDAAAGFGAVICHYEAGTGGQEETMLVIMINTRRQYLVGEVNGAVFQPILPWTEAASLNAGYNVPNRMRVEYDGQEFSIFFNQALTATFKDEVQPYHSGGTDGQLVVISPLDRFPGTPVHVLFRER